MFFVRYMRNGFLILLLMLPSVLLHAHPVSGKYDGLLLAFDKEHQRLTGYFESYTGWDESFKAPRFSCIFYLEARQVSDSPVKIKTWYPGDDTVIEGELTWSDDPSSVFIKLPTEHGGCWNVQPFAREKVLFELMEPTDWLSIEIVTAKKAYFYRSPSDKSKTRAYVIARDVIRVLKRKHDWVYAEYRHTETGKVTRGWVKKKMLLNAH